ncbi:MAG: hypothetical protein U0074_20040 [Kouleothrix sp.]
MDASIRKGQLIILAIVAVWLIISFLSTFVTLFSFGPARLWRDAVQLLLSGALWYCLYRGQTWARWLMVFFLAMAGVLALIGSLSVLRISSGLSLIFIGLGAIEFVSAGLLGASKDVTTFLAYQATKYSQPSS